MAARKKRNARSAHRSSKPSQSLQAFYTPFVGLDQHLSRATGSTQDPPEPSPPEEEERMEDPQEEENLFLRAMSDVAPLPEARRERVPPSTPNPVTPRFFDREELEVVTHLMDLVTGDGPFELSCSDEYVDGAIVGLSPKILKKLRKGEFSTQDYLDLHGCTREEARALVTRFLKRSFAAKYRCVLVVSGRGLNSKDREPVLKRSLVQWLIRAPLKRLVLAFASARSYDGGAGAFYILLRRNEHKDPPLITPAV